MSKEVYKPDPVENRKQTFANIDAAYSLLQEVSLENQTLSEEVITQLLDICKAISEGEKTTKCFAAQVKLDCWNLDNTATLETSEKYAFQTMIIAAILDMVDSENSYIPGIFAVLRHDLEFVTLRLVREQAQEFVARVFSTSEPFEAVALLAV